MKIRINERTSKIGFTLEDGNYYFDIPSKIFKGSEKDFIDKLKNYYKDIDNETQLKYRFFLDVFKAIKKAKEILRNSEGGQDSFKDGIDKNGGYNSSFSSSEENWFFAKLEEILSMLANPLEKEIYSLKSIITSSENYDYPDIDSFFDESIYVDEETILITQSKTTTKILGAENELVNMYCYVYLSVVKEFEEEELVDSFIESCATEFRLKHQLPENFFDDIEYAETILKDVLESIYRNSYLRNSNFYEIYNFLERFLYKTIDKSDKEGYHNSIEFWQLWELLCLAYVFKYKEKYKLKVRYFDFNGIIKRNKDANKEEEYPFYLKVELRNEENKSEKIYLRPDLVLEKKNRTWIIDFKYEDVEDYYGSKKGERDILKQHIYKLCMDAENIRLAFFFPHFDARIHKKYENWVYFIPINFFQLLLDFLEWDWHNDVENEENFENILVNNSKVELKIELSNENKILSEFKHVLTADIIYNILLSKKDDVIKLNFPIKSKINVKPVEKDYFFCSIKIDNANIEIETSLEVSKCIINVKSIKLRNNIEVITFEQVCCQKLKAEDLTVYN